MNRNVSKPAFSSKKGNWLLSFTGLIPVILTIPLILFNLWAISIVTTTVSALVIIVYHLRKGQGVTTLDVVSLLFGLTNAVLYFGFHNTFLLEHLDTVIYTLLFIQVLVSIVRGKPWTEQYAKRTVVPELWETKAFHQINRSITILWGLVFLLGSLCSLLVSGTLLRTLVPIVLLLLMAILTPRLARIFGTRVQQSVAD